jgi:hypothetical protein
MKITVNFNESKFNDTFEPGLFYVKTRDGVHYVANYSKIEGTETIVYLFKFKDCEWFPCTNEWDYFDKYNSNIIHKVPVREITLTV